MRSMTPLAIRNPSAQKGFVFWHSIVAEVGMSRQGAIILIEDDLDDQEVLREVFAELEVKNELRFFDNCDAAYTHLVSLKERPFLILCDVNLPKTNGIELKQRIDSTGSLRKKATPFVFLTTSAAQQTVDTAYQITNLQGYFVKSSTITDIKQKIQLILEYWQEALHPL